MIQNIFISYSSKDIEAASQICSYLESRGMNCFIAPRNILPGTEYGEAIINAIEKSDMLLLVCTATAIDSQHVLREVERAVSKRIPLLTLKLDKSELNKSLEYFLLTNQFLYAEDGVEKHLEELYNVMLNYNNTSSTLKTEQITPRVNTNKNKSILRPLLAVIVAVVLIIGIITGIMLSRDKDDSEATGTSLRSVNVKTGDYISFGSFGFNGNTDAQKILWVVVNVDENGNAILLSDQILTICPYDTAESGNFDKNAAGDSYDRNNIDTNTPEQMIEFRGNSDWESSTIRTWLNSDASLVTYEGAAPADDGSDEHCNGYDTSPGFLNLFTDTEKQALVEYNTVTESNALTDKNQKTTTDRVFLLSEGELYNYVIGNSISPFTKVTQNAIDNDSSSWYKSFSDSGCDSYIWALRTPVSENSYQVKTVGVNNKKEVTEYYAGASGLGIRPAIQISTDKISLTGSGSRLDPYIEE